MDRTPLVSFCMSTYKRPEQLKKQLEGILQQEYANFEIVISDNDPDASAKEITAGFKDPRVRYFHNEQNLGMVKSFNKSIARSGGEYIVMITDDDPVYPGMLSTLIGIMNKYPGYGVYAGCADWIVETEFSAESLKTGIGAQSTIMSSVPEGEVIVTEARDLPLVYLDGYFSKTFLLWSCCIIERSIVEAVKGMPDYGSELLTDHAYIIATGSRNGFVYINKTLGGQSVRGDNFGFNFEKVKEKYLATPGLFFTYLQEKLSAAENWELVEPKLRAFIGRAWVEYSLMVYRSLKARKESTRIFFSYFHKAFSKKFMRRWKYKFYLKCYFPWLFNLLIQLKGN